MRSPTMDQARDDYRKAQRSARLHRVWGGLTGQNDRLVAFEELKRTLRISTQRYGGLHPVALDKVVGSIDRSADFDRAFMPTQRHSKSKWLSVDSAYITGVSLPAISLYKVGDAYFVVDGHHRVSVSRQKGRKYIDAEVIEVQSRVPVTADITLDDLDVLGAYREFLEQTKLDILRPDQDARLTMPGDYQRLSDHIATNRYFIETDRSMEMSDDEAVTSWYDTVYMPVVETIRQDDLLGDFPGATEADLYMWIIEHAYYLSQETGQSISAWEVSRDYAERFSRAPRHLWQRILDKVHDLLVPDELDSGPPAGTWREERIEEGRETMFRDILVTLTGAETGWLALSQAAEIARLENSTLRGIHIARDDSDEAREHGERVLQEFAFRCESLGVHCTSQYIVGDVSDEIVSRARWVDLVAINQRREHGRIAERPLGTIFQSVAGQAARPILAVPGTDVAPIHHVMLAYDGSPKAREGLYILRHMIKRWGVTGVVLTAEALLTGQRTLNEALEILKECGVQDVQGVLASGTAHEAILETARDKEIDLVLMGGYGHQPLLKAFLGSTVDRVLRVAWFPVLISR